MDHSSPLTLDAPCWECIVQLHIFSAFWGVLLGICCFFLDSSGRASAFRSGLVHRVWEQWKVCCQACDLFLRAIGTGRILGLPVEATADFPHYVSFVGFVDRALPSPMLLRL